MSITTTLDVIVPLYGTVAFLLGYLMGRQDGYEKCKKDRKKKIFDFEKE